MKTTERRIRKRQKRSLPPVGTVLTHRFSLSTKQTIVATIVEASQFPEGKGVKLGDKVYRSLSGAAQAATGTSLNGWIFWKW
jgi:hypothetical protein